MAKFKANDKVIVKSTNEVGTVIHSDQVYDKKNNHTEITYLVKTGSGLHNYAWHTRKELERYVKAEKPTARIKTKVYDVPNGYKITMVSIVETELEPNVLTADGVYFSDYTKQRVLRIGVAFYNPTDEYDEEFGYKLAKHRAYNRPFTYMVAPFTGEFNEITTDAIMDAKSVYLIENIDKFI